jgi:hypothetical protein
LFLEAVMMKRKGRKRRKLRIHVSFEPSRLGHAALEEAYERLAPSGEKAKAVAGFVALLPAATETEE